MNVVATGLPEVRIIVPRVVGDSRGYFFELFRTDELLAQGIPGAFVQDNVSCSRRGVLRGLHFQHPYAQGKLVAVLAGEVYDVAVDVRVGSPTFGRWVGEYLSADPKRLMYVPPGFAHGFLVLSEEALFTYKCTEYYHPESERAIRWNDPDVGIDWPSRDVLLSDKDRHAPMLSEMSPALMPAYSALAAPAQMS